MTANDPPRPGGLVSYTRLPITNGDTEDKLDKKLSQPITVNDMPRPGGIASYMRLPTTNRNR